jgi:hypothetical protein
MVVFKTSVLMRLMFRLLHLVLNLEDKVLEALIDFSDKIGAAF